MHLSCSSETPTFYQSYIKIYNIIIIYLLIWGGAVRQWQVVASCVARSGHKWRVAETAVASGGHSLHLSAVSTYTKYVKKCTNWLSLVIHGCGQLPMCAELNIVFKWRPHFIIYFSKSERYYCTYKPV
jgi:hypothetical protein